MPELPEVETTLRGIAPALTGRRILSVVVHNTQMRWPVPAQVQRARGRRVARCRRRAKYLLLELENLPGGLLLHLGMSGSLRVCAATDPLRKHDHIEIELEDRRRLRFNDPRRFGAFLWWEDDWSQHPLLRHLGPEPLSADFSGEWLNARSRGRKAAVKTFIMDQKTVVGVGNIYASEALFLTGIHPSRPAGRISAVRYAALAEAIRDVLSRAIDSGGTTLRDFHSSDGRPGYFAQELLVYGREGRPCFRCSAPLRRRVIGQRSSFYCPQCQR